MATNPQSKRFNFSNRKAHGEYLKDKATKGKHRITAKQHSKIIKIFLREIKNKIISEAYIWHLPFKLGAFFIKGYQTPSHFKRFFAPGGDHSKKYRIRNQHTFNKYFRIRYDKTYADYKNKSYVRFKPFKQFKVQLSKEIFRRSGDPTLPGFIAH